MSKGAKIAAVEKELVYRIHICEALIEGNRPQGTPDAEARLLGYRELLRFVKNLRNG